MRGSSADDEEERRGGLPSAEEVSPRALFRFGLNLRLVADHVVLVLVSVKVSGWPPRSLNPTQ